MLPPRDREKTRAVKDEHLGEGSVILKCIKNIFSKGGVSITMSA